MYRTACLTTVALTLVLGATFGQSGTGPGGFRSVGGFGGDVANPIQRIAQLEMEGSQKLEGTIQLRAILVDSELGQYAIDADKIRSIRFLKRMEREAEEDEAPPVMRGAIAKKAGRSMRDRHGNVLVPDSMSPTGQAWLTHGKVITTSGKEIVGDIRIPTDFRLELEFGHLTPAPDKLRALTLLDAEAPVAPKAKGPAWRAPAPEKK